MLGKCCGAGRADPRVLHFVWLIACAVAIYLSCELFVNAVEWLGQRLNVGQLAVGTVLAAIGTALPESVVTFVAVTFGSDRASADIGVGAAPGAPLVLAAMAYGVVGAALLIRARRARRTSRPTARVLVSAGPGGAGGSDRVHALDGPGGGSGVDLGDRARLGRDQTLIELSATLQGHRVDLVVLDQGVDTWTAVGRMFFSILGAIAEFEASLDLAAQPAAQLFADRLGGWRCPGRR